MQIEKSAAPAPKKEEREKRHAAIDKLIRRLQSLGGTLAKPQARFQLRDLKSQLETMKSWRPDFPEEVRKAEELVEKLSTKRTEVVQQAEWEIWARTDVAARPIAELELVVAPIEAEASPETALAQAIGLGPRLFGYAENMRDLGKLDPAKDRQLWESFWRSPIAAGPSATA